MNIYAFLADAIAAIHLAYVAVVVLGQLAIMIGWLLGWQWIRNPWFRITHLVMIMIVAAEALGGVNCPLTDWEWEYRELAGQQVREETFVGRFVGAIMFYNNDVEVVLSYSYYVVAGLIVATAFLIPPRFRRRTAVPTISEPTPQVAAGK